MYEEYNRFKLFNQMPQPGGLEEQPAWWVDAIEIVQGAKDLIEYEDHLADKAKRKREADAAKAKK